MVSLEVTISPRLLTTSDSELVATLKGMFITVISLALTVKFVLNVPLGLVMVPDVLTVEVKTSSVVSGYAGPHEQFAIKDT